MSRDTIVQMHWIATVERKPSESDADLLDRVENAAHGLAGYAPFSGVAGVLFFPGDLQIVGSTSRAPLKPTIEQGGEG